MAERAAARPSGAPGRICPISYRYGAAALAAVPAQRVETLWAVGGLYGNPWALARVLELFDAERGTKALVFNGDFHWFDIDPRDFERIERGVSLHAATRGNVETELADPDAAAGCGCGYPDWVGDAEVGRSNRILERLRLTARGFPAALGRLAALPMIRAYEIGGYRVGVVHGDAHALAGWSFSQERLADPEGAVAAARALDESASDVIACSHTCLPVLRVLTRKGGASGVIANNGAAGMPNFQHTDHGIATRISLEPQARALHRETLGALHVEAVPIAYDSAAWLRHFVARWPAGSDAFESYHGRLRDGPRYAPWQAWPGADRVAVAA